MQVQAELDSLGLDSATLAHLKSLSDQEKSSTRRGSAFQYSFNGNFISSSCTSTAHSHPGTERPIPRLTLFVQFEDGIAVDAALSPDTKKYLETLARHGTPGDSLAGSPEIETQSNGAASDKDGPGLSEAALSHKPRIKRVEVPLTFDAEFFDILLDDITSLDTLQTNEQKILSDEIEALSTEVTAVTKRKRFQKTDMYRWRELIDIYLQAGVFFSTHEIDHGNRSHAAAARQLQWFQGEVARKGLLDLFKLPASRPAFNRFIAINVTLLMNLKFQEINKIAITKILKKFDKRTHLGVGRTFTKIIASDPIISETMAKAVCAQMSTDLSKIVPQVDDYSCPICSEVQWRPVRMKCRHIFCSSCAVKMQKQRRKFCPLCREDVVLQADEGKYISVLCHYLEANVMSERVNLNLPRPGIKHRADLCSR
ncbi:hypothetical protein NA56DRAFT_406640 [Hyaloscypha hepaticicola]|uniref:RING-14 protein n=1 Tax=Hyaloscypha hepaticicola TaxID=2082293 RepID=A0A2J6PJ87_9HELO|nr:hypothetical protein NA56DRAFT_406640 [Hyaloscypha hepaticicola]